MGYREYIKLNFKNGTSRRYHNVYIKSTSRGFTISKFHDFSNSDFIPLSIIDMSQCRKSNSNANFINKIALSFWKKKPIRRIQRRAADSIGYAFSHTTDKEQAWQDLHRLTQDVDSGVRMRAADSIGYAFPHIIDKEQAWQDLHRLALDKDNLVQWRAADALGSSFSHVTKKEKVWQDLYELLNIEDSEVIVSMADALVFNFHYVTDKEKIRQCLFRLAEDKNSYVRQSIGWILFNLAKYYVNEKDFDRASNCFLKAASASKYGLIRHIKPTSWFYLYSGIGFYYRGRLLVGDLLTIKDPEEYVKTIQNAVNFF